MGKGDRKTAKGKRSVSSYGNARSHVEKKAAGTATAPVAKKTGIRTVTKTAVKKTVTKKVATKAG
ncbi:MAG: 30S ribosomal protein THX [Luteimonas sp.]